MHLIEYRICMPLSVEEYKIGQLYMIARHSNEQSSNGEGVEIVTNEPCTDPVHGKGQYTEKRVHLSSKLPTWVQAMIPRIFYITEKAWNYYPYTITEYSCSFVPKLTVHIETRYENNAGTSDNCLGLSKEELEVREVDTVDIGTETVAEKHYKESEDPKKFHSQKTNRGPLKEDWKETSQPLMCSYKVVRVKFEVWGLQTKVESYAHSCIRDVLLLGHVQAFTWIDSWIDMSLEELREYENTMNEKTNKKFLNESQKRNSSSGPPQEKTSQDTAKGSAAESQ